MLRTKEAWHIANELPSFHISNLLMKGGEEIILQTPHVDSPFSKLLRAILDCEGGVKKGVSSAVLCDPADKQETTHTSVGTV